MRAKEQFVIQRSRPSDNRPWYWSGPMSWTTDPAKAKKLSKDEAEQRLAKTRKWGACKTDRVIKLQDAWQAYK